MAKYIRLDSRLVGFAEKVNPKTNERLSYYFIFKIGRNKVNYRLCGGDATLSQAKELYKKARALQQRGIDPRTKQPALTSKTQGSRKVTFAKVRTEFTKRHLERRCSPQTVKQYNHILDKYFDQERGIESFTRKDILKTFDKITDEGHPVLANRYLAYSKKFFNFATAREHYDKANPVVGIERNVERARVRILNETETKKVWLQLYTKEPYSVQRNLFILMMLTGQRHGELKQLRVRDCSREELIIQRDNTKNKKSDFVLPLPEFVGDFLMNSIDSISRDDSLVFPSKSLSIFHASALSHWFKSMAERAGVNNTLNPHDLRRSLATELRRNGFELSHVQSVLNHTRADVTSVHYDMYSMREEKLKCLSWWSEYLRNLR